MFIKLEPNQYGRVTHLFKSLLHNLSIAAVIDQKSLGWIYCDHEVQPLSAFIGTMEGYFLAGKPNTPSFNLGVQRKVQQLINGETVRPSTQYLEFEFSSPDWLDQRQPIFLDLEPIPYLSRHYMCNTKTIPNRKIVLPPGFSLKPIDGELIEGMNITLEGKGDNHFHPLEWASGFGSINKYLDRGFGFAMIAEGRIVSWAMSDCVVNNKSEIGVYTMPEYRRQGLGGCAASAAVEYALGERKIELIGWHCNKGNIASQKTAEKVGFKLKKKHQRHHIMRPFWRHHAELGLRDFHTGNYQSCVERYRYVFGQTNEAENHIYHLAAMAAGKVGDKNNSIIWLKEAAERGWKNLSYTISRPEFDSLRRTNEWNLIIQKIKVNN